MRLDPRNRDFYLFEVAWAYTLMGRYAEAVPLLKRALARYRDNMGGDVEPGCGVCRVRTVG